MVKSRKATRAHGKADSPPEAQNFRFWHLSTWRFAFQKRDSDPDSNPAALPNVATASLTSPPDAPPAQSSNISSPGTRSSLTQPNKLSPSGNDAIPNTPVSSQPLPASEGPHGARHVPTPMNGVIEPAENPRCDRMCAIRQKSLDIAQKKLSEKKLPPLEHPNQCSHLSNAPVIPIGKVVCFTIEELEATIQTDYGGEGTRGRIKDFLKVFKNYAIIVDTAVQHSPKITALVWAGVRATLQVCLPTILHYLFFYPLSYMVNKE